MKHTTGDSVHSDRRDRSPHFGADLDATLPIRNGYSEFALVLAVGTLAMPADGALELLYDFVINTTITPRSQVLLSYGSVMETLLAALVKRARFPTCKLHKHNRHRQALSWTGLSWRSPTRRRLRMDRLRAVHAHCRRCQSWTSTACDETVVETSTETTLLSTRWHDPQTATETG